MLVVAPPIDERVCRTTGARRLALISRGVLLVYFGTLCLGDHPPSR
jgi:hypothetical protein